MVKDSKFVLSRNQYAVDLGSFRLWTWSNHTPSVNLYSEWWQVDAVWFRRKRAQGGSGELRTVACVGTLKTLERTPPADVYDFLEKFTYNPWGGDCDGRWDGTGYWGAQEPEVIDKHLALLRPMLDNYPQVPEGYTGWWRFDPNSQGRGY